MTAAQPLPEPPTDDDLAGSLADAMDEGFSLPRDEHDHPILETEAQADWAMRKLARITARIAQVNALADDQVARVERWRADQLASVESSDSFFRGLLGDYHRRILADDPAPWDKKTDKTIHLPHGTLTARAARPKLEVDDETVLVDWLKDRVPELVTSQVVWKWSKTEVRKTFVEVDDGRLVDRRDCEVCGGSGLGEGEQPCEACGSSGKVGTGEVVPAAKVGRGDPKFDQKPAL